MRDPVVVTEPTNRDKWVIDPSRTIAIVPDYPHKSASSALLLWLAKRFRNIQPFTQEDVCVMRNRVIRDMKTKHWEWVAMFDNDLFPTAASDEWFEATGDVVCMEVNHKCHGSVWSRPDSFHANAFRVNRKVLDTIGLPWFQKRYSEDGCTQIGCGCQFFRDKVLAAGNLTIARAGWMNHGDK